MGKVVEFRPRGGNKIYSHANTALEYIKKGERDIAVKYIKNLPKELRTPVAQLVDKKMGKSD